eukprot:5116452-Heterocapsa_arctica.AAC.1
MASPLEARLGASAYSSPREYLASRLLPPAFWGARLVCAPCPSPGPLPLEFICRPFAGLPAL